MNKLFSICFLFLACHFSSAQNAQRFRNEIFSTIDSLKNVQYGEVKNINSESEKLFLDIYSPNTDTLKKRPLVIFVHGGGFVNGDKSSGYPTLFCTGLAKRGYVSSSINYRLGIEKPKNDTSYFEAMYRGVQDAKAAVRFFRKNAEKYGIDTSSIYIMGGSAGSKVAMHLAYLDQNEVPTYINTAKWGNLEGKSGNEGFSSKVSGVVNCWGAMIDYRWINSRDVPLFSVHGTRDKTVPFDSSYAYHGFKFGSTILFHRALALGIPTGIKLFENAGHTLDNDKYKQKEALEEIGQWLFTQLNKSKNVTGVLRFEKEILEFEKLDITEKYSDSSILVTGSSYIRIWKTIKQDLAPQEIIPRGFGGSNIAEMAFYIDRIMAKHQFKAIVFYSGSNDITAGNQDKSPTQVLETFKYVVQKVRQKYPIIPIYYVAISPNERRWVVQDKIVDANQLFKNYCQNTSNLYFIETMPQLLGKDGKYQAELYVNDKLHFNEKGYQIWSEIIRRVLNKDFEVIDTIKSK
jgi:pimeloyl-ACP methyl ester carboxylesterase